MNPSEVYISNFDYDLPNSLIAEYPLSERDLSKLLVYHKGSIKDHVFRELPTLLDPETTIVVNNTKVIEARLYFQKDTGAKIEIFCLSPHDPAEMNQSLTQSKQVQWNCLIGGASKWKPGQLLNKKLVIEDTSVLLTARYVGKSGEQFIIEFSWDTDHAFAEVLHAAGAIPLPPYIKRKTIVDDSERYQTVFAQRLGSVAAPTAALHFTTDIFNRLTEKGINKTEVTLNVGAGTFKPVKSETIAEHSMHAESFSVSIESLQQLMQAKNIVAVGTTSLRTLESLYWIGCKLAQGDTSCILGQWEALTLSKSTALTYQESLQIILNFLYQNNEQSVVCTTSLLIMPGYQFHSANGLITNFHQPRSTLLLLVAAFIGNDWKKVYNHALSNQYRFLSYGDSSLLWRR